jgi:peptide/nickel transport system permease protein
MEVVFGIPGLGSLLVNAMEVKDIYVVQGCVLFLLSIALTMNLLVDVLYGVVDPRVRYGMK